MKPASCLKQELERDHIRPYSGERIRYVLINGKLAVDADGSARGRGAHAANVGPAHLALIARRYGSALGAGPTVPRGQSTFPGGAAPSARDAFEGGPRGRREAAVDCSEPSMRKSLS